MHGLRCSNSRMLSGQDLSITRSESEYDHPRGAPQLEGSSGSVRPAGPRTWLAPLRTGHTGPKVRS